MGRSRRSASSRPLPLRDGVDPVCFRLPQHLPEEMRGRPAIDILRERFDRSAPSLTAQLAAGTIVDDNGQPLDAHTCARPGLGIWSYRPLPSHEPPVPLDLPILFHDDVLLVVDKPHFLPTIPRGRYVTHTALVQLRRTLPEPFSSHIAPAHRLDRHTAGVLLFTVQMSYRRPLQQLFATHHVKKRYFAIAPLPDPQTPPRSTSFLTPSQHERHALHAQLLDGHPVDIHSRIVVNRNRLNCTEEPGEPNSHTTIRLRYQRDNYGLYELLPHTGKTHQLRVHMNHMGTPIVGDPLYPVVLEDGPDYPEDPQRTLQLLAAELQLPDPRTDRLRCWRSNQHLSWPDGTPVAAPYSV